MTDQSSILIVSCQPEEARLRCGVPSDRERIAVTLGWPKDTGRLREISAITDSLPTDFAEAGVIICGSKHAVYEDLPWIRAAEAFVRRVYAQGKPILGLCFGHQLIVKALGGSVKKGQHPEKGMVTVTLSDAGMSDPLFDNLGSQLQVATHHDDSITKLPTLANIRVLAFNANEPYQALAIGDKIRTLAFHADMRSEDITKIVRTNKDNLLKSGYFKDIAALNKHFEDINASTIDQSNRQILHNFVTNFVDQ